MRIYNPRPIVLGFVFVVIVLLFSFYLLFKALYQRYLMQTVWPLGAPSELSCSFQDSRKINILIVGDSRAKDWFLSDTNCFAIMNCAIAGSTTGQLKYLLPVLLDKHKPDIVIIQSGINDLKLLGLRPDLESVIKDGCFQNIREIALYCIQRNCKVFVTFILPPNKPFFFRRFVWNNLIPESVLEMNYRLAALRYVDPRIHTVDLAVELHKSYNLQLNSDSYLDTLHLKPHINHMMSDVLSDIISKP